MEAKWRNLSFARTRIIVKRHDLSPCVQGQMEAAWHDQSPTRTQMEAKGFDFGPTWTQIEARGHDLSLTRTQSVAKWHNLSPTKDAKRGEGAGERTQIETINNRSSMGQRYRCPA